MAILNFADQSCCAPNCLALPRSPVARKCTKKNSQITCPKQRPTQRTNCLPAALGLFCSHETVSTSNPQARHGVTHDGSQSGDLRQRSVRCHRGQNKLNLEPICCIVLVQYPLLSASFRGPLGQPFIGVLGPTSRSTPNPISGAANRRQTPLDDCNPSCDTAPPTRSDCLPNPCAEGSKAPPEQGAGKPPGLQQPPFRCHWAR